MPGPAGTARVNMSEWLINVARLIADFDKNPRRVSRIEFDYQLDMETGESTPYTFRVFLDSDDRETLVYTRPML